jgi:hypothetical protein
LEIAFRCGSDPNFETPFRNGSEGWRGPFQAPDDSHDGIALAIGAAKLDEHIGSGENGGRHVHEETIGRQVEDNASDLLAIDLELTEPAILDPAESTSVHGGGSQGEVSLLDPSALRVAELRERWLLPC